MQKFNPNWSQLDCVNFLQQKIIKLSIAYYDMDYSFIDDSTYDEICFQLVDMHKSCPDVHLSRFWYMMYDFDGSTGADLSARLTTEDKEWLDYVVAKEIEIRERPKAKKVETAPPKKKKGRLF